MHMALTTAQRSARWRNAHADQATAYNTARRMSRAAAVGVAARMDIPLVDTAQRQARAVIRRNAKAQRDQLRQQLAAVRVQQDQDTAISNATIAAQHAATIFDMAQRDQLGIHIADRDRQLNN